MGRMILSENEKNEIKNQYDDIDRSLMNFLLRRAKIEDKKIGEDDSPINFKAVSFEGLPGYGFNSFRTKKEMEKSIIDMLYENDNIDFWPYDLDERDQRRIKVIKTIRNFIDFVILKK
jgi:GTP-binding protein EngB required for normal cell division